MTTQDNFREQWEQRLINIRVMMEHLPCGQIEGIAHEKWVGWWVRKVEEREGIRDGVLERLQHFIATTPPAERSPCRKGVVLLKASEQLASCDPQPASIRKENELQKVEGERVLKRRRLDFEERFEQAKADAQGFEASERVTHSTDFLERLKTAVANELLYWYND